MADAKVSNKPASKKVDKKTPDGPVVDKKILQIGGKNRELKITRR